MEIQAKEINKSLGLTDSNTHLFAYIDWHAVKHDAFTGNYGFAAFDTLESRIKLAQDDNVHYKEEEQLLNLETLMEEATTRRSYLESVYGEIFYAIDNISVEGRLSLFAKPLTLVVEGTQEAVRIAKNIDRLAALKDKLLAWYEKYSTILKEFDLELIYDAFKNPAFLDLIENSADGSIVKTWGLLKQSGVSDVVLSNATALKNIHDYTSKTSTTVEELAAVLKQSSTDKGRFFSDLNIGLFSKNCSNGVCNTCSFQGDTRVKTDCGLVPIKDIDAENHLVWSRSDDSGVESYKPILAHYSNTYTEIVEISFFDQLTQQTQSIQSNKIHPYFVKTVNAQDKKGDWLEAQHINEGDFLFSENGKWLTVTSVSTRDETFKAYNLTIEGFHTYFFAAEDDATSVWVHNDCFEPIRKLLKDNPEFKDSWHVYQERFKDGGLDLSDFDKIKSELEGLKEYIHFEKANIKNLGNSFKNTSDPETWLKLKITRSNLESDFDNIDWSKALTRFRSF